MAGIPMGVGTGSALDLGHALAFAQAMADADTAGGQVRTSSPEVGRLVNAGLLPLGAHVMGDREGCRQWSARPVVPGLRHGSPTSVGQERSPSTVLFATANGR